ncbi:MAG: hypothetical protein ABSC30_02705 [Acidimicrobiales bacterium]|jgi:hypothetical protein
MTDRHLTDEQLSSHLDGVSTSDLDERGAPSPADHLTTCAPCRQRLAALETVRDVVRTPVAPLAPEVRAASIASVLRAAGDGAGADAPDQVHDAPAPIPIPRRRPAVLVGAAAAVLVLALAIGIPVALSGHGTSGGSEASGPARAAVSPPSPVSGKAPLPQHVTSAISDLGTLDSIGALRSRVDGLLPAASAAAPTGQAATGAIPGAASPAPAPSPTAPASSPTAPVPSPATPTPSGSGSSELNTLGAGPATTSRFEQCLASAKLAVGPAESRGTVELLATATFEGVPALVYVFEPLTGTVQSAVVVARDGCKALATTSL